MKEAAGFVVFRPPTMISIHDQKRHQRFATMARGFTPHRFEV